jgi:hypothetical protein
MAQGDFTPTGTLTTGRKDVRLMLEASGAEPLAALPGIAARMDQLIAEGHGEEDLGVLAMNAIATTRARRGGGGVAHFFGALGWAFPQLPSWGGVGAQRLGPVSVGHRELFAPLATTSTISIIP